jgi:hypothetical protein
MFISLSEAKNVIILFCLQFTSRHNHASQSKGESYPGQVDRFGFQADSLDIDLIPNKLAVATRLLKRIAPSPGLDLGEIFFMVCCSLVFLICNFFQLRLPRLEIVLNCEGRYANLLK